MARQAVVDTVEQYLADHFSAAPIIGENTVGVTPVDGSTYVVVQYPYARSEQVGFGDPGNRLWRDEGAFRFVVHTERGRGSKPGRDICDQLADLFRGKDLTVIQTTAPSAPVTDDRSDAESYWVMSIAVPYRHDYYA